MVGWWVVSPAARDVWRLMPLGAGRAWGSPRCSSGARSRSTGPARPGARASGLASGLVLYVATRVFVWIAAHWAPFRRDVVEKYEEAADGLAARARSCSRSLIMVPAEELFWRGLVPGAARRTLARAAAAAALTWLGYVVANLPSRSLPIVAGAIVGGALWTGLAWWSGGVLASLGSHILWTGADARAPARGRERKVEARRELPVDGGAAGPGARARSARSPPPRRAARTARRSCSRTRADGSGSPPRAAP